MKIAIYSASEKDKELFGQLRAEHEVVFFDEARPAEAPVSDADIISVFIDSEITAETLDKLPKVSLITTRSTGFDHIDTIEARKRNIAVCNVPTYGARTVAEFAFALIFALNRQVNEAYEVLRREGQTDRKIYEGFDLNGKTIGVIGTGHIGANVIRIARGFAMKVIASDLHPNQELINETGVTYLDLNELLAQADIISLHLPLNDGTRHILNQGNISQCKPGSIIINTARGGLIETTALLKGLKDGRIRGAGLDVLEGEEHLNDELSLLLNDATPIEDYKALLADHELLDLPQVIVTPHIAFNTAEAKAEIREITLRNIQEFISGHQTNIVN
ncbi:MAG: NAD(P)-dependent oxidoreductase [Candidatus Paceibacterota bacterium]